MIALQLARPDERLSVLCLGAHADDIEIGAGGTLLGWIASGIRLEVSWCVLSAPGLRAAEAEASAAAFLPGAASTRIEIAQFDDGLFPYQGDEIKAWLEDLRGDVDPDVVLTHRRSDAHQDHRELSKVTWNLFRDHLILEYEIPKWDGDLGRRTSTCRSAPRCSSARSSSCRLISGPNAPSHGSMRKPSAGWRACGGWNVAHPSATRRPSSRAKRGSGSRGRGVPSPRAGTSGCSDR
jgi:hypothetical protein